MRIILLWTIFAIVFFCPDVGGVAIAQQIEQVSITPRTLQRETDLKALNIVVPDDKIWKQSGDRLKKAIETKYGSTVELKVAPATALPGLWSGNTILIGNLGNNRYFSRLYAMRYTFVDAYYPGKAGYQLQTLVDPFGRGGNTIIIGASDVTGLEKGLLRFEAILEKSGSPQLPWLNEAVLADEVKQVLSESASLDGLLEKFSPEKSNYQNTLNVFNRLGIAAENYHLTGNPKAGEIYKNAMLAFADFVNANPKEAMGHLNESRNIWTHGSSFYAGWYVAESSPLFNDAERRRIVSAVYIVLKANSQDWYLKSAVKKAPRNNHETYPARALLCGAIYFLDHYSYLDYFVKPWYKTAEQMFTNNTAIISRDDGSDYMMHTPQTLLDYSFIMGDMSFLNYGLRASADLQTTLLDNLGVMAGGGDGYPFGNSSTYHWGHSRILYAASWYYRDPKYQHMLERVKNGPFPNQAMFDLKRPLHFYRTDISHLSAEENVNHSLVQGNSIDEGIYQAIGAYDQTEISVAQPDTFHKLAFRKGLGVNDAYLVVDGNAAGRAHNHHDANAILRYSEHSRIFLDTREFLERGPEHKTGMIVVKDGVQESKPVLAKVNWVGDIGGITLSQTELPDYNGADWQRAIISPGGRFFLILDHIQIKKAGNYMLENVWQSLGDMTIKKDRFEVVQQGVTMTLQSLDESELRSNDRYHHFKQYYRRQVPYPYADEENVLREVKEETAYQTGDSFTFVNVLSSSLEDKAIVEAEKIGKNAFRLIEGKEEWLAIWHPPVKGSNFQTDGQFFLFGEGILAVAGMRRLTYGSLKLSFKEPVLLRLDLEKGEWKAYSVKTGMKTYNVDGNPIEERIVSTGKHKLSPQDFEKLKSEMVVEGNAPEKPVKEVIHSSPDGWNKINQVGEEITSSTSGDLNGDGIAELIVGTVSGKVQVFSTAGKVLWTYETGSRVNELTVAKYEDRTVVTIANEDWTGQVLDTEGKEIWKKKFESTRPPSQGSLMGITNIRVANIEGEGKAPWFMVGAAFNDLYGVNIKGEELYNREATHYGVIDMQFADYAGNGKDMGVLGMEYVYPALFWSIAERPAPVLRIGRGPGWKVVRTLSDNKGKAQGVLLGTKEHIVHYAVYEKEKNTLKEQWATNVGGEVNDMLVVIGEGGGGEILVGSSGHQMYVLNRNGSIKWRAYAGDRVQRVRTFQKDGIRCYLAGLDNGKLLLIDPNGKIDQTVRFSFNIENVLTCPASETLWVVLQDGQIFKK